MAVEPQQLVDCTQEVIYTPDVDKIFCRKTQQKQANLQPQSQQPINHTSTIQTHQVSSNASIATSTTSGQETIPQQDSPPNHHLQLQPPLPPLPPIQPPPTPPLLTQQQQQQQQPNSTQSQTQVHRPLHQSAHTNQQPRVHAQTQSRSQSQQQAQQQLTQSQMQPTHHYQSQQSQQLQQQTAQSFLRQSPQLLQSVSNDSNQVSPYQAQQLSQMLCQTNPSPPIHAIHMQTNNGLVQNQYQQQLANTQIQPQCSSQQGPVQMQYTQHHVNPASQRFPMSCQQVGFQPLGYSTQQVPLQPHQPAISPFNILQQSNLNSTNYRIQQPSPNQAVIQNQQVSMQRYAQRSPVNNGTTFIDNNASMITSCPNQMPQAFNYHQNGFQTSSAYGTNVTLASMLTSTPCDIPIPSINNPPFMVQPIRNRPPLPRGPQIIHRPRIRCGRPRLSSTCNQSNSTLPGPNRDHSKSINSSAIDSTINTAATETSSRSAEPITSITHLNQLVSPPIPLPNATPASVSSTNLQSNKPEMLDADCQACIETFNVSTQFDSRTVTMTSRSLTAFPDTQEFGCQCDLIEPHPKPIELEEKIFTDRSCSPINWEAIDQAREKKTCPASSNVVDLIRKPELLLKRKSTAKRKATNGIPPVKLSQAPKLDNDILID